MRCSRGAPTLCPVGILPCGTIVGKVGVLFPRRVAPQFPGCSRHANVLLEKVLAERFVEFHNRWPLVVSEHLLDAMSAGGDVLI